MRKTAAPREGDEGELLRRRKAAHNEEDNFDKHGDKKTNKRLEKKK